VGKLKYDLIDIAKPEGNYMVLESLTLEKNIARMIHILTPSAINKKFKIGREHESDLRINDISVSRLHATIKYKNE
jgi:pSer/pThr/pTyr-binding forkhead associated (FHA) protein